MSKLPSATPNDDRQPAGTSWAPNRVDLFELLKSAEFVGCDHLLDGSNYTFLGRLREPSGTESFVVYKPGKGEAPLYDFPAGTLYRREYAAYLISEALGWSIVPPTTIRSGPYGEGSVQLFIEADGRAHYFTFGASRPKDFRRMAAFDVIINNADRKSGHCLLGLDGRVWGVDHGLCFHHLYKLRTVIWDFSGDPMPREFVDDFCDLLEALETAGSELTAQLRSLLSRIEVEALVRRVERLIEQPVFPMQSGRRSVPWPLV